MSDKKHFHVLGIPRPVRSPDLRFPDFFVWGYFKECVYRNRLHTIQELQHDILENTVAIKVENFLSSWKINWILEDSSSKTIIMTREGSGTAVAQWLRRCATNRIPAGVTGFFVDIKSFRSHYGPGVDSACNRNEYQEYFLGVKAVGA